MLTAKNSFGKKSKFTYKIWLSHNGGDWASKENWSLTKLIIEDENKKQTVIDNRKKPTNDTEQRILGKVDGITFTFIEGNNMFTRVVTSKKVNKAQIEKAVKILKIETSVVYFHMPGKLNRGEEYANKSGKMIFLFE